MKNNYSAVYLPIDGTYGEALRIGQPGKDKKTRLSGSCRATVV